MGMIQCEDCGHQIGENALFCPQCGSAAGLFNLGKRFIRWGFMVTLSVFAVMAGIAFIIFLVVRGLGG
jgi:hypothetical protein